MTDDLTLRVQAITKATSTKTAALIVERAAERRVITRDRDGTRSAETACPAPVPQDCQARAEGIAKGEPK